MWQIKDEVDAIANLFHTLSQEMAPSYQAPFHHLKVVWSSIPPFLAEHDEEILYKDDADRCTRIYSFIAASVSCTQVIHVDHEALFDTEDVMLYRHPQPYTTHPERCLAVAMLDNILTAIFEFIEASMGERVVAPGDDVKSRVHRHAMWHQQT